MGPGRDKKHPKQPLPKLPRKKPVVVKPPVVVKKNEPPEGWHHLSYVPNGRRLDVATATDAIHNALRNDGRLEQLYEQKLAEAEQRAFELKAIGDFVGVDYEAEVMQKFEQWAEANYPGLNAQERADLKDFLSEPENWRGGVVEVGRFQVEILVDRNSAVPLGEAETKPTKMTVETTSSGERSRENERTDTTSNTVKGKVGPLEGEHTRGHSNTDKVGESRAGGTAVTIEAEGKGVYQRERVQIALNITDKRAAKDGGTGLDLRNVSIGEMEVSHRR